MKQAVMTSPGKIDFRDVPFPKIEAGKVLIRMMRIGVCGSDLHVYHGKHPYTSYPVVQGHEVSGIVERVGEGVSGLNVGDRVTIQPQVFCGKCYSCTHGKSHICDELKVMGFQTTGAASEFFLVEADKVLKLPLDMSLDHGAMVEPVAVGVHALSRGGDVKGMNILVLGAGPIGNLTSQVANGLGASTVMVTDLSDYRLEVARQCGIDMCVNPKKTHLSKAVLEHFGANKADLILECVGSNDTTDQAIDVARKGSDIVIVGVFADKPVVDLGLVQDRELRLIGTLMYQKEDFRTAIELINTGKVKLTPLISNHFAFHDYLKAYEYIEKQKDRTMKVMIDIQAS
jgi:L-iditol 2-dehydrogenase